MQILTNDVGKREAENLQFLHFQNLRKINDLLGRVTNKSFFSMFKQLDFQRKKAVGQLWKKMEYRGSFPPESTSSPDCSQQSRFQTSLLLKYGKSCPADSHILTERKVKHRVSKHSASGMCKTSQHFDFKYPSSWKTCGGNG